MPRETQRRRSERASAELNDGRNPVRIQEQRRFFTAQGNDRAVREARAIERAFGVGTEFADNQIERNNEAGVGRAAADIAGGRGRDEDDKNAAYIRAWDEIDAERDLNLAKKELPELLRGFDWENKSEAEVQDFLNNHFESNYGGAEGSYANAIAPGLLELETTIVADHRDMQIARVQQEQRSTVYANLQSRFEETGTVDYEYAAKMTATFADGADKKTNFLEMMFDMAVDQADESIIDNMPERFPSGDPTGINDPRLAATFNAARSKAVAAREAGEREAAAALKAQREAVRDDANRQLVSLLLNDQDPTAYVLEFLDGDMIEGSDATAAISAWRSSRDDNAKQGFNPGRVAQINTQLALAPGHASVSPQSLQADWASGVFGPPQSPEARNLLRQSLQDRDDAMQRAQRIAQDPRKKVWAGRFNESFPIPKDQFGIPVPGPMLELRAAYSAEFELALLGAGDDAQYRQLFSDFSEQYKKQETLVNAQVNSTSPRAAINNLARGNFSADEFAAFARTQGWTAPVLISMKNENELGDVDPETYRAALEALANN